MATNIKFDTLLSSLTDLQHEKIYLEQKLEKCREKRRRLEMDLERGTGKYLQVRNVRNKMSETLKVALLKVTQTQELANRQEESNLQNREKISSLNKDIEREKVEQLDNMNHFETLLSDLAKKFCQARQLYKDDNLEDKVTSNEVMLENLEQDIQSKFHEADNLSSELEELVGGHINSIVPEELCNTVWHMVRTENDEVNDCIRKLENELTKLRSE